MGSEPITNVKFTAIKDPARDPGHNTIRNKNETIKSIGGDDLNHHAEIGGALIGTSGVIR